MEYFEATRAFGDQCHLELRIRQRAGPKLHTLDWHCFYVFPVEVHKIIKKKKLRKGGGNNRLL